MAYMALISFAGGLGAAERRLGRGRSAATALDAGAGAAACRAPQWLNHGKTMGKSWENHGKMVI